MDWRQGTSDAWIAAGAPLDPGGRTVLAETQTAWRYAAEWLSTPYNSVAAAIGVLLGAHLLLVFYTVYLRLLGNLRDRRLARRSVVWNDLLMAYLTDETSTQSFVAAVPRWDRRAFANFIKPYLLDFQGEERERLMALMEALQFPTVLARLLRSRREWDRAFAAHMLGIMGAQACIPALRPLLEDRSELARYTAAEALMQLRDAESVPRILTWLASGESVRFDRVLALVYEFGSEICPALLEVVERPDANLRVRRVAVDGLAHYLYLQATWSILELSIHTPDRELRLAALRALVAFEDTTLRGFFESLLEDRDLAARAIAARALGAIGDESMVPRLVALARTDDFWVANETVRALVALGEPGTAALLAAQSTGDTSNMTDLLFAEVTQSEPAGGLT